MGPTTYLLLIISPDILKQSNLNLHHQLASSKNSNPLFLDMVSLRPSSVTIDHSMPPTSLLHLHHRTTSNISQVAHYLYRALDRQNVRIIQTAKRLLKNVEYPYMALLTYHTTPLTWCNLSPAQLLMGRCLWTTLPQVDNQYHAEWKYLENFRKQNMDFK